MDDEPAAVSMIFFTGIQVLKQAAAVDYAFISINRFIGANKRVKDFPARTWIMDSGAFSQDSTQGDHKLSTDQYAKEIKRWSRCGILAAAAAQDYMCEDFILKKLNRTVLDHQKMTLKRYKDLIHSMESIGCKTHIMPVLQGYETEEYINHLKMYDDLIQPYTWVGVGSVCKRNSKPEAVAVILDKIKQKRPDLKLHGFGIKKTCLQDSFIYDRLFSSDSMAWSFDARYQGKKAHDINHAISYKKRIETMPIQESML